MSQEAGGWGGDTYTSDYDTQSRLHDHTAGRTVTGSGRVVQGSTYGHQGGLFGSRIGAQPQFTFDIVGMHTEKIQDMINAIETYTQNLEDHMEKLIADAPSEEAYQSDVVRAAVVDYLTRVRTYCMNLVSQFRAFQSKLVSARDAWQTSAQSMASRIEGTTGSFNQGTRYDKVNA